MDHIYFKMVNISIVTGASSGLGKDIAKLLCKKGHIVYSIARGKDKLLELQKECSKHKGLHVEMERGILEVLDENERDSVKGRVIATGLNNLLMPFGQVH